MFSNFPKLSYVCFEVYGLSGGIITNESVCCVITHPRHIFVHKPDVLYSYACHIFESNSIVTWQLGSGVFNFQTA